MKLAKKILIFCLFIIGGNTIAKELVDKIVATVNDKPITYSELQKQSNVIASEIKAAGGELPPNFKKEVLNKLINDEIQIQLADESNIQVSDADVDRYIAAIAESQNLTVDDVIEEVKSIGMTPSDYRKTLKRQILIERVQQTEISPLISISESDVDRYLSSSDSQKNIDVDYRVSHILIAVDDDPEANELKEKEKLAMTIKKRIDKGESFEALARENSDSATKLKGGDFGYKKISDLPTFIAEKVSTMKVGQTVGPIQNSSGFHIIKLKDKKGGIETKKVFETKLRHILVADDQVSEEDARRVANRILDALRSGDDFATLAKRYSKEDKTSFKGGDVGFITDKDVLPDFARQMNKLKPGETSDLFQTEMGWHIILVEARREQAKTSDSIRNRARDAVFRQKFQDALLSWMANVREQAEVNIVDPKYK